MAEHVDIAVVGAGAAGLMAAIWAGRTARLDGRSCRILALDRAKALGAKILISGGGRCNVTHETVDETAFAGSTPHAIRTVLRRFDVPATTDFFRELGVGLKREETGKLFPTTDDAGTVLRALTTAAADAGVELRHPAHVDQVARPDGDTGHLRLTGSFGVLRAQRVILATGGRSLPRTGSDGHGYELARSLGHTLTPLILPALVPLVLHESCFLRTLAGLTIPATLQLVSNSGKRLVSFTDSTLCTHFGISGPSALNISRHYLHALADDPGATLFINWLPGETTESLDRQLGELGRRPRTHLVGPHLSDRLPKRLIRAICEAAGVDPRAPAATLTRPHRRALAAAVTAMPLPVVGHRGFSHAEVTAGGVPLKELNLKTMESRICPGLYLCGEICDVDGRIGGYNFQWAWSSGYVAGTAAARPAGRSRAR